jgi:DNA-binding CsgD family transcriptional regulator
VARRGHDACHRRVRCHAHRCGPAGTAGSTGSGTARRRERGLVTLVAQGRTDAQIAGLLFISIRTVRSHLDRIRDKTRCRRRADLIRLVLQAGLV